MNQANKGRTATLGLAAVALLFGVVTATTAAPSAAATSSPIQAGDYCPPTNKGCGNLGNQNN